jgi:glutathione S-transferase
MPTPASRSWLPFESRTVDMLAAEQHLPAHLEINPTGTRPAMVHGGVLVPEVHGSLLDIGSPS